MKATVSSLKGFVQFSGEEERSSGAQAEGGKAMESVGAKGCARFRADKKAVIRQARGVLRERALVNKVVFRGFTPHSRIGIETWR